MSAVTLILGDCLERMAEIDAGSVDMVLADLPYGSTNCAWDAVIPFDALWKQYRRVIKPGAAIVLTAGQPFTTALISSNMEMFKYCWYWEKSKAANFVSARYQPLRVVEDVCVFSDHACTFTKSGRSMPYNPQKIKLDKPIRRDRSNEREKSPSVGLKKNTNGIVEYTHAEPRNLLYAATDKDGRVHPTQKPVALMEYLIRTYSHAGDTVLDNTMGSGTTGVACVNTGRKFIGIERDAAYFAIAQARIDAAAAQAGLFAEAANV